MTKNGFVMQAMGFTGKEAMKFIQANKEALNKVRASAEAVPGTIPLRSGSNSRRIIVTREEAVKKTTHPNSADIHGCGVLPVAE